MKFIHVKNSDLLSFSEKYFQKPGAVLPITPWRAVSQQQNPYATPDDVLLIAAVGEQEEILGFIGVLPGRSHIWEDSRIFWNSCWWIQQGGGAAISMGLLQEFLKITGNKVLFSDLSERTADIFKSLGGYEHDQRQGVLWQFRSGLAKRTLFVKRDRNRWPLLILARNTGVLKILDFLINCFKNRSIQKFLKIHSTFDIKTIIEESPSSQSQEFMQSLLKEPYLTIPEKELVRWWQDSEWLVKPESSNIHALNDYHFSTHANDFRKYWVQLKKENETVGVAFLTIRDGVVKIPYLFYQSAYEKEMFSGLICHLISSHENYRLLCFHEAFSNRIASMQKLPGKWERVMRYTAISETLLESAGDIKPIFQDGDGDSVFT